MSDETVVPDDRNGDNDSSWRGIAGYVVRHHLAIGATVIAVATAIGGCLDHVATHEKIADNAEKIEQVKTVISKETKP